ncbi:MAG TPA: nuclear transport factor 2 family protein [Actinomycetota bacterium]|nr:nuclear transport factor 2 family protein [Actinomycetota bacterium]
MSESSNHQIVERYMRAFPMDFDVLERLRHPDYIEDWPQSGERIRGHQNYVKIHQAYPGGLPEAKTRRIVGSEDRWVTSPSFTIVRINGAGDTYTVEGSLTYPSGESTHLVAILDLRDGRVAKARHYFADPFTAPEWRAGWVEPIQGD